MKFYLIVVLLSIGIFSTSARRLGGGLLGGAMGGGMGRQNMTNNREFLISDLVYLDRFGLLSQNHVKINSSIHN